MRPKLLVPRDRVTLCIAKKVFVSRPHWNTVFTELGKVVVGSRCLAIDPITGHTKHYCPFCVKTAEPVELRYVYFDKLHNEVVSIGSAVARAIARVYDTGLSKFFEYDDVQQRTNVISVTREPRTLLPEYNVCSANVPDWLFEPAETDIDPDYYTGVSLDAAEKQLLGFWENNFLHATEYNHMHVDLVASYFQQSFKTTAINYMLSHVCIMYNDVPIERADELGFLHLADGSKIATYQARSSTISLRRLARQSQNCK